MRGAAEGNHRLRPLCYAWRPARMRWLLRLLAFLAAFALLGLLALKVLSGPAGQGRHAAAIELNALPPAVFAHLVQPELLPRWVGGLQRSEPLGEPGPRVGAKTKETLGEGDDTFELLSTITRLEPDRQLGVLLEHARFVTRGTWVVRALGTDRTLLIYEATTRYQHPSARLFVPILMRLDQRKLEADLLRLKALMEAPGAAPVAEAAALSPPPAATAVPAEDPTITASDEPASAPPSAPLESEPPQPTPEPGPDEEAQTETSPPETEGAPSVPSAPPSPSEAQPDPAPPQPPPPSATQAAPEEPPEAPEAAPESAPDTPSPDAAPSDAR